MVAFPMTHNLLKPIFPLLIMVLRNDSGDLIDYYVTLLKSFGTGKVVRMTAECVIPIHLERMGNDTSRGPVSSGIRAKTLMNGLDKCLTNSNNSGLEKEMDKLIMESRINAKVVSRYPETLALAFFEPSTAKNHRIVGLTPYEVSDDGKVKRSIIEHTSGVICSAFSAKGFRSFYGLRVPNDSKRVRSLF
jgi:hypothetical protein